MTVIYQLNTAKSKSEYRGNFRLNRGNFYRGTKRETHFIKHKTHVKPLMAEINLFCGKKGLADIK